MNPKHGRHAQSYPPDEGPPTDELLKAVPAEPQRARRDLAGWVRRCLVTPDGRPRVVVIIAVFGLALVAVAAFSYRAMTNSAQANDNTVAHFLTYKASSTGKTVLVTFTRGDNDVDGQATAASPWSLPTTVTTRVAVLTVNSGGDPNRADSVTCAIVDTTTGETLVSNTAPPSVGASVTCVTGNLKS